MSFINVLDENTINKIAAGEVVEKPMAVIKELVENSIDAGASAITVEIKNGGLDFMRITDNGKGIACDELPLAFERHATSKIKVIDDLSELSSLGFRGEALASIAAVSMVECITKTSSQMTGIKYEIDGGVQTSIKEIGCPDGTTFVIRNLFFNTPARRKFLKTPSTEGSYIADLMEKFSLSHPDIAFKFINNGQTKLQTNGTGSLKNVIYQIYGRDITSNIIEVECKTEKVSFNGYIGRPLISRGNRGLISSFVNGRYVKSPIIYRAIEEAFSGYHMSHKYPFAILNFKVNSHKMDVNVHPSKMEIRFSEADEIYAVIFNYIKNTLKNIDLIPAATLDKSHITTKNNSKANYNNSTKNYNNSNIISKENQVSSFSKPNIINNAIHSNTLDKSLGKENSVKEEKSNIESRSIKNQHGPEPFETKRLEKLVLHDTINEENITYQAKQDSLFDIKSMKAEQIKDYHIVGCVFSTYWIIQYHDEMYIMDQHAAHEKVLYENFCNHMKIGSIASQHLSPPLVLTLSSIEAELINKHEHELTNMGFTIEHFGGNEYMVSSIPADLPGIASENVLTDWLAELSKEDYTGIPESVFRDKLASMSCKAAVKGGRHITEAEADSLVKQLFVLENPFNCPHGRPTMIKMTKHELEKKFGRVL